MMTSSNCFPFFQEWRLRTGQYRKRLGELLAKLYSASSTDLPLPRIKDNKTIGVTDEDAAEEYCGQQSIFPGG